MDAETELCTEAARETANSLLLSAKKLKEFIEFVPEGTPVARYLNTAAFLLQEAEDLYPTKTSFDGTNIIPFRGRA